MTAICDQSNQAAANEHVERSALPRLAAQTSGPNKTGVQLARGAALARYQPLGNDENGKVAKRSRPFR